MTEPVQLSQHRNTKQKHDRRAVYEAFKVGAGRFPKDADGYVTVHYKVDANGDCVWGVDYYVRDARDRYRLPAMAEFMIREGLSKS